MPAFLQSEGLQLSRLVDCGLGCASVAIFSLLVHAGVHGHRSLPLPDRPHLRVLHLGVASQACIEEGSPPPRVGEENT